MHTPLPLPRPFIFALAGLAALAVAGCAAATPGYTPPPSGKHRSELSKPFDAGTVVQSKGNQAEVYQVSEAERKLECGKLTGSMHVIMRRLGDAANKPQQSATSKTLQDLAAPIHQGKGLMAKDDEIRREKARLKAYSTLLAEKKCKPVDISAHL